jgi:hypothetical protein
LELLLLLLSKLFPISKLSNLIFELQNQNLKKNEQTETRDLQSKKKNKSELKTSKKPK